VNEFRDERVDGLIRARNRLVWVMLAVAISAYFTLSLALLFGVSTDALAAASVFYLVGAVTGLINRLRIESGRPSAVEDYGLYLARLISVPVLSGLTAIGGVYLASKTPEFLGAITTGPAQPMKLEDIFSLARNELGVLVAATFGLVPAQLFSGLQRQAERFQTELEKSEPSGGSSLPGSGGG